MLKFRAISQLVQLFLLPEVRRRHLSGALDDSMLPLEVKQFRAIQRRVSDGSVFPVTEINDEVNLVVQTKARRPIAKGDMVMLEDIHVDECFLQPPDYDGNLAAYFLCQSVVYDYYMHFDCRPNMQHHSGAEIEAAKVPFPLSDLIDALKFEQAIQPTAKLRLLAANNWPPAPGYFPATFLALHRDSTIVNDERIVAEVTQSYGREYWSERLVFWQNTKLFSKRVKYVDRAICAHLEGDYICAIYVLVPQFEGIIKDYLEECGRDAPSGFVKSVRALRDLVYSRMVIMFPRDILDSIFDFLETGTFWQNTSKISNPSVVINRHGIAHGVFVDFESLVVSLKHLILLDALGMVILHDRIVAGSLS